MGKKLIITVFACILAFCIFFAFLFSTLPKQEELINHVEPKSQLAEPKIIIRDLEVFL